MINYFFILITVLILYMTVWFLVSLIKKRNDLADIAWGLGFIILAWVAFLISDESGTRPLIANALVTIWGLRLAIHIYNRNKGKPEDYRYNEWRKSWGKLFYLRSYFQIYILQGMLLFVIVSPVLLINKKAGLPINFLDVLGVWLWLIGFYFETVGDAQLIKFIKNPANKGKLMKEGLWQYTRHPNYFGETVQWWGIWLIALSVPYGFWTIIGPLTITVLITKISGIPMLEKKMNEHPEFKEYKEKVSVFFPLPPKKSKNNDL